MVAATAVGGVRLQVDAPAAVEGQAARARADPALARGAAWADFAALAAVAVIRLQVRAVGGPRAADPVLALRRPKAAAQGWLAQACRSRRGPEADAAEDGTSQGAGEEPERRAARLRKISNVAGDGIKSTAVHGDHLFAVGEACEDWPAPLGAHAPGHAPIVRRRSRRRYARCPRVAHALPPEWTPTPSRVIRRDTTDAVFGPCTESRKISPWTI